MNSKTQTIETKEDLKRYRDAFDTAILALNCPSEADVLICHALGVALGVTNHHSQTAQETKLALLCVPGLRLHCGLFPRSPLGKSHILPQAASHSASVNPLELTVE
jgi:hypothetical protein